MPAQEVAVPDLSPGTRLALARLLFRILRGLGLLVMGAWGLLIVAWATVHWFILPHIDQWRGPIERQATQLLGQPVRIGAVRVTSSGLVPAFELKDVALLDAQAQPALRLPRVVAALSAHSLLSLEPRFAQLLIEGAHLEMHRDAAGRLFVAGLDFSAPARGDRAQANWFFKQHEVVIRGGSVRWTDELHPAPPLALTDVQVVVRNSLRHHDLRIDATPPSAWGDRFSVSGVFTQPLLAESADWKRWRGTLHASLPDVDVRTLRQHATLPFDLTQGQGALRAWVDVVDGRAASVTLDVALRNVALRIQPELDPLGFAEVTGRLVGRRDDRDTELTARQFGFVTVDGVRWPASNGALSWRRGPGGAVMGGELTAERLDLALMTQVARRLPMGDAVHRLLADFDPRGTATALSLRWDGAPAVAAAAAATASAASSASAFPVVLPPRYELRTTVSGLALAAAPAISPLDIGRPGVRQADVQLTADQNGGEARIAMTQGELDLPGVFEDPRLPLDRFAADLTWRVEAPAAAGEPPQVRMQAKGVQFANADVQGELHGSWSTGTGATTGPTRGPRYPGRLELDARLTQGVAARAYRYLPLGIRAEARQYVQHAVRDGRVPSVTFRVKGDLNDFPFADAGAPDSEFRVTAQVDKASLAYVPDWPATATEAAYVSGWPALDEVSGELRFDRLSMEIRNAQARVQGVKLSGVQGGIKTLADQPVLVLDGTGRGAAADLLRFVNASPVGGWTGDALAQATATGPADLKLGLSVPLADLEATAVRGSVTLVASDFRLRPDTPLVAAARGRVDFSEQGFSIVGASGRLLGGDLSVDGGLQPDGSMRFVGQGTATAEGLRRGSDVGGDAMARLANSLSGQAGYRVALNLARGQADLLVTSNLVGLASDLPAPLNKAAESPLALRFQNAPLIDAVVGVSAAGRAPSQDVLRLDLGTVLQAMYVRDTSGATPRVLRGGIGVLEPAPSPPVGVAATLNLGSLNLDAWEQVVAGLSAPTAAAPIGSGGAAVLGPAGAEPVSPFAAGYLPTTIGLRAVELQAGSRRLNRVVAGLSQEGSVWRVNLDADQVNGYIEYRAPRGPAGDAGAATTAAAAGRVYARLSRLSLPKEDVADVETLLDQPAAQSVPALDIVVDDLDLRGKRLGRMELEAINRPGAREWRLTRLALTMPEAKLTASGNWTAVAGSGAAASAPARRVALSFKLELSDSGALAERLGFGKVVRGGKGGLSGQVAWLGSPLSLDYPSLTGQINISIAAGQFLKAEPGVGRLLGVLSLQALPRRLVLDFRDVFQQGFAFDDISGDVQITQGVAQTNNLRMRGVQAAVLMEGKADIEQETQDLRVIVVPEIDAGTASLAYAAINPALGLGAFLAQALFSKPLIAANTREFQVSGTWADPKVDKVERKFGAPVPDIPAPSSSMPSSLPSASSAPPASGNEPTPKP